MGWLFTFATNSKMDFSKLKFIKDNLDFHHFGFVCKSIDRYKSNFLILSDDEDFYLRYEDVEQNVKVGFIRLQSGINIELIEVLNLENYSPISNFILKNNSGYHHICYETKSFEHTIDYIKKHRYRLVSKTKNGFEGRDIAFFIPKDNPDGPLIEIASEVTL
jgi:catechol 2,3-dioxygenase-like lactoylglutathione lyase family enzyme